MLSTDAQRTPLEHTRDQRSTHVPGRAMPGRLSKDCRPLSRHTRKQAGRHRRRPHDSHNRLSHAPARNPLPRLRGKLLRSAPHSSHYQTPAQETGGSGTSRDLAVTDSQSRRRLIIFSRDALSWAMPRQQLLCKMGNGCRKTLLGRLCWYTAHLVPRSA